MSIPVSITKAARAALFAYLQAQLTPADSANALLVCLDSPGQYQPSDIVAVGQVERVVTPAGMVGSMGASALHDSVTIHVKVTVYREGDYAATVFDRACDLVDAVVNAVRADPTLSGSSLVARPTQINYGEADWTEDSKGRMSDCDISILCTGLI